MLYSIESRPVVALTGTLPAWRTLAQGISDGADVRQLEQSLVDLGYDPEATVTVDDHFDANTKSAVKRFQAGHAAEQTGKLSLGSVVFLPARATVLAVSATVGARVEDGAPVLTLSGGSQQVFVDIPAEDRADVVVGLRVDIGGVAGTIVRLRSTGQNGVASVQAVIAPSHPLAVGNGEAVTVRLSVHRADGELVVPVEALLSRLDGTYAVQLPDEGSDHRFATVRVLAVSGRDAAVSSDVLTAGDEILVPA
ncbi:MAG TPA: peptidoglycan-binding domain-containing protein [Acidimicrobiales bacterium]